MTRATGKGSLTAISIESKHYCWRQPIWSSGYVHLKAEVRYNTGYIRDPWKPLWSLPCIHQPCIYVPRFASGARWQTNTIAHSHHGLEDRKCTEIRKRNRNQHASDHIRDCHSSDPLEHTDTISTALSAVINDQFNLPFLFSHLHLYSQCSSREFFQSFIWRKIYNSHQPLVYKL